jgi:hypothetical protein
MQIKLVWKDPHGEIHEITKDCGLIPIMVRVRVLHLHSE